MSNRAKEAGRWRTYSCQYCGTEMRVLPPDDVNVVADSKKSLGFKRTTCMCENCHKPNILYWHSKDEAVREAGYSLDKGSDALNSLSSLICARCGEYHEIFHIKAKLVPSESRYDFLLLCSKCNTIIGKGILTDAGVWK